MRLRPLREADLPILSSWLPRAAADAGCDAWAEDALARGVGRESVLTATGRDPALLLAYETGVLAPDAARIRLLAVHPERRRLGLGGEAALALERRLAKSMGRIYVLVPSRLGIALYFWLRLGYRPLTRAEWPTPPEEPPAAWMVRDLARRVPSPRPAGHPSPRSVQLAGEGMRVPAFRRWATSVSHNRNVLRFAQA